MDQQEIAFLEYLKQYITPHKVQLMEQVLAKRTRYFTVVLEDIFKPHNASAVLRTADCFGLQDVYVLERENSYRINPFVTRGSSQWIDLIRYNDENGNGVKMCFSDLRAKGYKIYATSPNPGSISIHDLQPDAPIALVFGNEDKGVSQEVLDNADGSVHIPMHGFTESFNISVSASIFLYDLLQKVGSSNIYLSPQEKLIIRSKWYRSLVKQVAVHEREFLRGL